MNGVSHKSALVVIAAAWIACTPDLGAPETHRASLAVPGDDSFSPRQWLTGTGDPGVGYSPVHATLLVDGRVLVSGRRFLMLSETEAIGLPLGFTAILDPEDQQAAEVVLLEGEQLPLKFQGDVFPSGIPGINVKIDEELFCGGHTLMEDGRVHLVGGSRWLAYEDLAGQPVYAINSALDYSLEYDPSSGVWTRMSDFVGVAPSAIGPSNARWYSTATRIHDGRILATGGYNYWGFRNLLDPAAPTPASSANLSIETIDGLGQRELLIDATSTPQQTFNSDYTYTLQLPRERATGHDVAMLGMFGFPVAFDPDATAQPFFQSLQRRPGRPDEVNIDQRMWGSSVAMLPLRLENGEWGYENGTLLVAGGGDPGSSHLSTLDRYDPYSDRWLSRVSLAVDRHHPSTTVLPDGRMLVIGGHSRIDPQPADLLRAEYYDPRDESVTPGDSSMAVVRGYHNVSLLLPDGRVLVAGGQNGRYFGPSVFEQPSVQYLSPSYMSEPRPKILGAPIRSAALGEQLSIDYEATGGALGEAVLISYGSITHSFDASQRYVQLEIASAGGGVANLVLPDSARMAPPGPYMLFVLDAQGVPSEAITVMVTR